MYEEYNCPLHLLDSHKIILGACVIILGIGSVLLNVWLIITFVHSHLMSFKSHLLVLNLCTACLARSVLGGFLFAGPSALAGRWIFGQKCCELFAFMHQLLGVFQMISLTILCFERYLVTKKIRKEKELNVKFYIVSIIFCWAYSITFSIPPLLHYGTFGCDASGTVCTLDWHFMNIRQTSFNFLFVIFTCFIPIVCIVIFLWKCIKLNRRQRKSESEWEQWSLTKNTFIVAGLILTFWIPQAILISWIFVNSWSKSYRYLSPPTALSILAPLGTEAATMVPVLCYMAGEPRIRTALLGRCKENYGIIKKGRKNSINFSKIPK